MEEMAAEAGISLSAQTPTCLHSSISATNVNTGPVPEFRAAAPKEQVKTEKLSS
jgi:hypothetical protein